MKRAISPAEAAAQVYEIEKTETAFLARFSEMPVDEFILQGVSIFRSATEGFPGVDGATDETIKNLLECLLTPKAPEPFMGGRTAAAWRVYTQVLIDRVASNVGTDLREVPFDYGENQDPRIAEEIDTGDRTPEEFQQELLLALNALRRGEVVDG